MTKTITVRVDEETRQKAEVLLDELGLNITTLFNACLKAFVREKRVPFELNAPNVELSMTGEQRKQYIHDIANQIIDENLETFLELAK